MKKSILALSALAVAGGLGLASSAQAVYFFGPAYVTDSAPTPAWQSADIGNPARVMTHGATWTADPNADWDSVGLELNPGSTGHELIVPYYSAQGATHTLIDIVNTDMTHGKAVKVRFRGAANSDDVLDFTVLMSPGDVWTADIANDGNGLASLTSQDLSCTLPAGPYSTTVPFITNRLHAGLTTAQQYANTREGYVEILNMADIPKVTVNGTTNYLYNAILHTPSATNPGITPNGAPKCNGVQWAYGPATHSTDGTGVMDALLDTNNPDATVLSNDYGLEAPTGGLTGGWALINQTNMVSFSADDTAVRAFKVRNDGFTVGETGAAWVAFSPQIEGAYQGGNISAVTADPLLTGGSYPTYPTDKGPAVTAQWYDLPDLSTPLGLFAFGNTARTLADTPTAEADMLANALGKITVNDEYVADPNGSGGAPMKTDWILAQPTRRYFAVVDYQSANTSSPVIVYNSDGQLAHNSGIAVQGANAASASTETTYTAGTTYPSLMGLAAPTPSFTTPAVLPYAGFGGYGAGNLTLETDPVNFPNGPVACLNNTPSIIYDREETHPGSQAAFSPGVQPSELCGEVPVISWAKDSNGNALSPLEASLTVSVVTSPNLPYQSGWVNFTLPVGPEVADSQHVGASYGLPVTGFAAISAYNGIQGYGITWPLRW